jgi:hypothetical protein
VAAWPRISPTRSSRAISRYQSADELKAALDVLAAAAG